MTQEFQIKVVFTWLRLQHRDPCFIG